MARPLRIEYPGAVYHVMNRGSSRQKVFVERRDYEAFLHTIGELHHRWRVEIFAYCLMGNHYHVCLRTPEGNLARVMRHLDGLYTQRFNRVGISLNSASDFVPLRPRISVIAAGGRSEATLEFFS